MNSTLWSRLISLLLAHALVLSSVAFAQQTSGVGSSRPRRVISEPAVSTSQTYPPPVIGTARLTEDITVRIGLATNASAVTISTTGQLLNASDETAPPVSLPTARVRLEPHLLSPLSPLSLPSANDQFRIEVDGISTREMAAQAADEIKTLAGDNGVSVSEPTAGIWRVSSRATLTRAEADELRSRLENAAYGEVSINQGNPSEPSKERAASRMTASVSPTAPATRTLRPAVVSNIKLTARVSSPTREVVAYAVNGSAPLLRERTPLAFASDDEQLRPLKYNDKTYRGRLEVFANSRGTLTVVNVLKLEDYVRGVVPNELSPGSFGAMEALKAQAVAARTYAVANRNLFASQGFDLLPTIRSQVYGGAATEHPLTNRAVEETRGIIATINGQPINALYTSTCGGRTEHAENIFGGTNVSYLRGRECATEAGAEGFATFNVRTSREPFNLRDAEHRASARDAALLAVHGFALPSRLTDDWLSGNLSTEEARGILSNVARLARHPLTISVSSETVRPAQWMTALALALDGESRADVLLDRADIDYLLAFRDADEIPTANRADVALFLRDDLLELYPDSTLRPKQALTRARALHIVARALEARNLFLLQKATARPASKGALIVRLGGKPPDRTLELSGDSFLFRVFGQSFYPARELTVVGGEPAIYHTDARGRIDYLEVRPAPNGASADHFSTFSNWTVTLTPSQVMSRLSRQASSIGSLVDLRVAARGSSRRALDLEVVGTNGTAHVRGGRIRSALGLREQLFVIDRRYDETGRLASFVLTGRGFGHGVGMCQVGAYGLARAGWSYDRILKAYYTGIELTKLY